jgi:hypothetical protein
MVKRMTRLILIATVFMLASGPVRSQGSLYACVTNDAVILGNDGTLVRNAGTKAFIEGWIPKITFDGTTGMLRRGKLFPPTRLKILQGVGDLVATQTFGGFGSDLIELRIRLSKPEMPFMYKNRYFVISGKCQKM